MSVIPAVLLNAMREYSFVGSPLWGMSDGKDLVRVELTFHNNLPTQRLYKKELGRKQEAACSLCCRVASPARSSSSTDNYASSPTNALCGEGDVTTICRDSTRHYKIYHHTRPHAEDSHHRDSTNHRSITNTASYSR